MEYLKHTTVKSENSNREIVMELIELLFLIITVLLLALCLFIGDKLLGNRGVHFTKSYYLNAIITAIVIVLIIIAASAVVGYINVLGIGQILPILSFVLAVYAIKSLLMKGATYERSTWVGLITWTMAYVINYIAGELFDVELIDIL